MPDIRDSGKDAAVSVAGRIKKPANRRVFRQEPLISF
jgi:hypothetical protein